MQQNLSPLAIENFDNRLYVLWTCGLQLPLLIYYLVFTQKRCFIILKYIYFYFCLCHIYIYICVCIILLIVICVLIN